MKKILVPLLAAALLIPVQNADASIFKKKKKAQTEQAAPAKKKTPYEKFVSKKGTKKIEGFVNVYTVGKNIWIEMPDSLKGAKLVFSNVCVSSTDDIFQPGVDYSANPWYIVDRTDSLVIFRRPEAPVVAPSGRLSDALDLGHYAPVVFAAPIKYRNADSTAVVFDATKLFSQNSSNNLRLNGRTIPGQMASTSGAKVNDEMTELVSVKVIGNSIIVTQDVNAEYRVAMMGLESISPDKLSMTMCSALTVVPTPSESFVPKEADPAVGTRTMPYTEYKSDGGTDNGKWAARWDLGNAPVKIYVSKDFNDAWFEALRKGIEDWNPALEAAGYANAFQVVRCPEDDKEFFLEDPLVTKVVATGGAGSSMGARFLLDKSTSRIISATITVPGDYVTGVRKKSIWAGDIDPEYAAYNLSEKAVLGVAEAEVRYIFGRVLGFNANKAAASAYSPAQLSDPAFTAENGIVASALSGVYFNAFADAEYVENGGVVISDRIGPYDYFAADWLYGKHSKAESDEMVRKSLSDRKLLYVDNEDASIYDPRALNYIHGNDMIAYFEALKKHLEAAVDRADDYLWTDGINDNYALLYKEFLFIEYSNAIRGASRAVGGIITNDPRSPLPRYQEIPAVEQKRILSYIYKEFMDFAWLDRSAVMNDFSGTNRLVKDFTAPNAIVYINAVLSARALVFCEKIFPDGYNCRNYLLDLSQLVLNPIRKGKPSDTELFAVMNYLSLLISASPELRANYESVMSGQKDCLALDEIGGRLKIAGYPAGFQDKLTLEMYRSLQEARKVLAAAGLEYYVRICDAALNGKQ